MPYHMQYKINFATRQWLSDYFAPNETRQRHFGTDHHSYRQEDVAAANSTSINNR